MDEAFRNVEAPDVLEAVQQPVGVGGIVAWLELPEPDEPGHAGVGRLFEQMLEVAPKPERDPLGDARFDPALRVHQCVGAEPLDRRRRRQDAALAEFERELIRERTVAGLEAARARGRKGGRKFALTKAQVRLAQAAMAHRDTSVSELCRELGIRPVTLYRYVGPQGQLWEQGQKVLAS